ncbi:MAG: hypothetical protein AAF907_05135 [Planctomycetota bacterium]
MSVLKTSAVAAILAGGFTFGAPNSADAGHFGPPGCYGDLYGGGFNHGFYGSNLNHGFNSYYGTYRFNQFGYGFGPSGQYFKQVSRFDYGPGRFGRRGFGRYEFYRSSFGRF